MISACVRRQLEIAVIAGLAFAGLAVASCVAGRGR